MVTVTTREDKGSKLTHTEMDANFTDLQDAVNIAKPETVLTYANYLAADKYVILVDCTAGDLTVTLPAASTADNVRYWVKKVDASISTVTIDPAASETIDGALTKVITTQWEVVSFISDGSNWFIL